MSGTISIEIPREVSHVIRMTPEELRRELAVYLFQQGTLSFGKAREVAEMTAWRVASGQWNVVGRITLHLSLLDPNTALPVGWIPKLGGPVHDR